MAKKEEQLQEQQEQQEQQEPRKIIDVTKQMVHVRTPYPRPGEEKQIFVSDGRTNWTVKLGMDVEVPYKVAMILHQHWDAEVRAYKFEMFSAERLAQME